MTILSSMVGDSRVAVLRGSRAEYPLEPPFHPPRRYPELSAPKLDPANACFEGVRSLFELLRLDAAHTGTAAWNPLGDIVRPGDRVLVKPNLVRESHLDRPDDWDYIITHTAVVRAVVDYVLLALAGRGSVVIADGPQTDSSFDRICERAGYRELVAFYRDTQDLSVALVDLREEEWVSKDGVVVDKRKLARDPLGYTKVELGDASEFVGFSGEGRYYGASFDVRDTNRQHAGTTHNYLLSRTAQSCDVLINVPKLKTHKKAGITCCLKNLVGINGRKNWLPHYTHGSPEDGGDQFARASRKGSLETMLMGQFRRLLSQSPPLVAGWLRHAKKLGRLYFGDTSKVIRSGNWYGNDTLWRMVLDLNKSMFYFDGQGERREQPRRYFAVVDGIVAGDGDGPMAPNRFPAGILIGGRNPVAVDCAAAKIMGFDWQKIPCLKRAFEVTRLPLAKFAYSQIESRSNVEEFMGTLASWRAEKMFSFQPHFGWINHVEHDRRPSVRP